MFVISNDEIENSPLLSSTIKCKICGEYHNVEFGDIVNEDDSKEKSEMLVFIKCPTNDECCW